MIGEINKLAPRTGTTSITRVGSRKALLSPPIAPSRMIQDDLENELDGDLAEMVNEKRRRSGSS